MKKKFTKLLWSLMLCLPLLLASVAIYGQQFRTVESGNYITALTKDSQGTLYATKYNLASDRYDVIKMNIYEGTSSVIYSGLQYDGVDYSWALAVDSGGDVFIAASNVDNKVIKLTYDSNNNTYTASDFMTGKYVTALTIDDNDNLYVAEYDQPTDTYRIVRYGAGTNTGGTILYGNIDVVAGYSYITSIVVAPNHDIYFNLPFGNSTSPDQGKVLKLSAADNYNTATTISTGKYSTAIGLDEQGNIYISEYEAASSTFVLNKYTAGTGTPLALYTLDNSANFYSWGIVVFNSQNIYFTTGSSSDHMGGALVQLYATPVAPATDIVTSEQNATSVKLKWTNGTGARRVVFMLDGTTGTPSILNNNSYTANTNFGTGSPDQAGEWYCIYNGTGNEVTVTGLQANHPYRVMVIEYNGVDGVQQYNSTAATDNPVNLSIALPVSWLNFDVDQKAGQYTWHWALGVESQVAYYIAQYSLDGAHFMDAGKQPSVNGNHQYSFTASLNEAGLIYFRVLAIDKDGIKSYSGVKTLNSESKSSALAIFPNPVSDKLQIKWPGANASSLYITIYNAAGKKVLHRNLPNTDVVTVSTAGLASGVYYLTVEDNLQRILKSGKFLKK